MERSRDIWTVIFLFLMIPFVVNAANSPKSLHPKIQLLDRNGIPVIKSGEPISTEKTCGACHDYRYITAHSYHAQQGKNEFFTKENRPKGLPDYVLSPGMFGKWCGLPNRVLAAHGLNDVADFDLGTPEWVQKCGTCHVGAGPSEYDRNNRRLDSVNPATTDKFDPDYHYVDARSGELKSWDWRKSGVMEMDCFLCHIDNFDRVSRDQMLREGKFGWAVTATLGKTGIVQKTASGWTYNRKKFDAQGYLLCDALHIIDPETENCAQCHGFGSSGREAINPFLSKNVLRGTLKMGRVYSPEMISESNLNIKDKKDLTYAWDVHAERMLKCTSCHYSLNNPAYEVKNPETQPSHLKFDPRLPDVNMYIKKPSHDFAKGNSCPETVADNLDNTMRRCEDCHDASKAHNWLPYPEHHFKRLGCETCHIPDKKMWALETADWTVLGTDGKFMKTFRGIQGSIKDTSALITGFKPAILPRISPDEISYYKLMPYNLITAYYWYDEGKHRPVFTRLLAKVYLTKNSEGKTVYRPDIVKEFDANGNGKLEKTELRLDTPEKVAFVQEKLKKLGVEKPVIHGEITPFSINHNVVGTEHAIRDCQVCHSPNSRLFDQMKLADYKPANTSLKYSEFCQQCDVITPVTVQKEDGIYFNPTSFLKCYYIIGHDQNKWVEIIGVLSIFFSIIGVIGHDIFRIIRRYKR